MAKMTPLISGWKTRPIYTLVAITGLLLYALTLFVFSIPSVIHGDLTTLSVFVIIMVVSLFFAGLIWRLENWTLALATLWGLLELLLGGGLLGISLRFPNSFFDFVIPVLLTVGGLLTVVGATVAFVQLRRGTLRSVTTRGERRAFRAIAIITAALVILSGSLHIAGITNASAEDKAGAILVELNNDYLVPNRLEIPVGETTRIVVENNDFFAHTFEIEELGIKQTILPFSELLIEFRPTNTGDFTILSEAPMTGDMEGTLVVTE